MSAERTSRTALSVLLLLVFLCGAADAVPREMNYQVMLTNESDEPIADQSVELIFKIWTASTGGSNPWTETHNPTTNSIGVASVVLGSEGSPLDIGFGGDLWLEVTVNGETLAPRRKLVAAPYAFHAANCDSLGGVAGSGYSLEGHEHDADYVNEGQPGSVTTDMIQPSVVSSINSVTNDGGDVTLLGGDNVSIAADDTANTITISAEAAADGDWAESGDNIYRTTGRVGVGTSSPLTRLEVAGSSTSGEDPFQVRVDTQTPLIVTKDGEVGVGCWEGNIDRKMEVNGGALRVRAHGCGTPALSVYDNTQTWGDMVEFVGSSPNASSRILNLEMGSPSGYSDFLVCTHSPFNTVFSISSDGGLWASGTAEVGGFSMPTGAGAGHVLTCDASGVGTWEASASGDDGDWIVSGDDVYRGSGGVGIGTSTPDGELHMHAGSGGGTMLRMTTDTTGTGSSDGFKLWMDSSGYTFMEQHEDAAMFFSAGGDEILALTPDGRAGIGTLSPNSLLHVAGEAQVGGFKMPTGASAGHVLTSDGSGVGTWQAPPGASDDGDWLLGTGSDVYKTSGNVGIGTASPGHDLHVESSDEVAVRLESDSTVGAPRVLEVEYTGTDSDAIAVYGASPQSGNGGFFLGGKVGVEGVSYAAAEGNFSGVWGRAEDVSGSGMAAVAGVAGSARDGHSNYGVIGEVVGNTPASMNYGVFGRSMATEGVNYAGYFAGDVEVTGHLSKGTGSFKIDHPLDPEHKYLYHSFVESPDMMNIYNGNAMLAADGSAWVELPDWFEALNRDFRYQLTAIGAPGPNLYVAETISANRFRIAGGEPGMTVSWQVTGIRQDPLAEANRVPVEEEKGGDEVGKYLYPEAYGAPSESGIGRHRLPTSLD
jgi:hypothetical protein